MKKLVAILAVIVLAFTIVLSVPAIKAKLAEKNSAVEEPTASEEMTNTQTDTLDYAAIYASHPADEVVASVGDKEICWDEYFTWFHINAKQIENYFVSMKMYYSAELGWDDDTGDGRSYKQALTDLTDNYILQFYSIDKLANEQGLERGEAYEQYMKTCLENDIKTTLGENGTEEEFYSFLHEQYFTVGVYELMNTVQYLNDELQVFLYGESSEKVSDKDALGYLEDNGYIYSANHILLKNTDADGNALDEGALKERYEKLKGIADELREIADEQQRAARFEEIKADICEDGGKAVYPTGYTFQTGAMVPAFENATAALGEYELSEPVESEFGYHLIIRLPLSADAKLDNNGNTARMLWAVSDYSSRIDESYKSLSVNYADGFEKINIADYMK